MGDSGEDDTDEGSLSPIFGFQYDDKGNAKSQWAIDPQLESTKIEKGQALRKAGTGFSTASGKNVKVSERALLAGKKFFEEDVKEKDIVTAGRSGPVGFTTGSGKGIKISEKALSRVKDMIEVEAQEKIPQNHQVVSHAGTGFSTASGKNVKISERALLAGKNFFKEDVEEKDIVTAGRSGPVGFTTGSGKGIKISEKALSRVKDMIEVEAQEKIPQNHQVVSHAGTGFLTASGKNVKISERALLAGKNFFKEDVEEKDIVTAGRSGPVGFTTGSGKGIKISEKALSRVKDMIEVEAQEKIPQNHQVVSHAGTGFSTASGKSVKISKRALLAGKTFFEEDAEEKDMVTASRSGPVGFTTGSGKGIKISEKALSRVKDMIEVEAQEKIPQNHQVVSHAGTGFSTASGKNVKISEGALLAGKNFFEDAEEKDMVTASRSGPVGFTTGSGKGIKISEKALLQVKDMIVVDGQEEVPQSSTRAPVGFRTAAGKGIQVSKSAISKGKGLIEVASKQTETTAAKSEAAQQTYRSDSLEDEVNDLTRSLLDDITTDVEFDWDCEETATRPVDTLAYYLNKTGDKITVLKAAVVRVYPMIYSLSSSTTKEFLSSLGYHKRVAKDASEREKLQDLMLPKIEDEVRTRIFGKSKESEMSDSELQALNEKCQEAVHEEFKKLCSSKGLSYRTSTVLRIRVVDADYFARGDITAKNALLSIWNPSEVLLSAIVENKAYEFYNLKNVGGWLCEAIRLSTTNETRITPFETNPEKQVFSRLHTDIETICSGSFYPLFNEVDTVGLVVDVMEKSDGPIVQIRDATMTNLKIKFWKSLSNLGYEKIIAVGNVVACTDLQWRQSSRDSRTAHTQDVSCFDTRNIKSHLKSAFENVETLSAEILNSQETEENEKPVLEKSEPIYKPPPPKELKEEPVACDNPQSRNQLKRRLLDSYEVPPEVAPLVLAPSAKKPRVSKKFVPPRRVDNKPS